MTTQGLSGTSQEFCRIKDQVMPQWQQVPSLGSPSTTQPAKGDGDTLGKGKTAVWRSQEKSCSPDTNLFGH